MKLNLQFVSSRSWMRTHLMNYCSLIKTSLCLYIMIKAGKPFLCKINFLKIKALAQKKILLKVLLNINLHYFFF